MQNPYDVAAFRVTEARRRIEGRDWAPFLVLVAGLLALPLARGSLYRWVDASHAAFVSGFSGLLARVSLVLCALLALTTYDALVRGPDRGVVDLHPLRPRWYLRSRFVAIVRGRVWWWLAACTALLPAYRRPEALALGAVVLLGAWVAGLGLGAGINLAAPGVATAPRWAGVLDAVRGPNPRAQAALLWSPGVALALAGLATLGATWSVGEALSARGGGVLIALPFVAGGGGLWLAVRSAPAIPRIPALLHDIEAQWAGAESVEEARHVYLDWLVPRVPAWMRAELLRELRHGWRAHRAWLTGAWGLGLLGAVAGWTDDPDEVGRLLQVGAVSLAVLGVLSSRLTTADPPLLDALLPRPGRRRARAVALFAWMQPAVWPGVAAFTVRQGFDLRACFLVGFALVFASLAAALPLRGYLPLSVWVVAFAGGWV